MEPKTKQYLLVTVVGVTLFVALLRLSAVLAFAAKLIDLVLPILAGGILALFINVPMTGLEKRLKSLFRKAKKQPSAKAIHLLSFFITLLGVALVLVLALTLLIPELVQSFHSLYVQIEANIPRWTAYLSAQNTDMGWLIGAEMVGHILHDCKKVLAVQPFGCMPNHICGRGLYPSIQQKLPEGRIVSADVDSGSSKLNVYNRARMLVDMHI